MRLDGVLRQASGAGFSLEVFPPKPGDDADLSGIKSTIDALAASKPDFISVTYSPAGRNRQRALDIAAFVRDRGLEPVSHLTAVGSDKAEIDQTLAELERLGVDNVLALRGDIPPDYVGDDAWRDFRYALDLLDHIKSRSPLCCGVAAYPEGHAEGKDIAFGIELLKRKQDAGASFCITQLFFDTQAFFRFRDKAIAGGITMPILAGIMPVTKSSQLRRLVELSGCSIPPALVKLAHDNAKDDQAMERAGVEYAAGQIKELRAGGNRHAHIYTMNRPQVALAILQHIK